MEEQERNVIREEPEQEAAEQEPAADGYAEQVRELYDARPELRGQELPQEVLQACVRGRKLTDAYADFAGRQREDADALRRENRALRQNAKKATQAPVRGVTRGGGVDHQPEDAFLRGFNEAW